MRRVFQSVVLLAVGCQTKENPVYAGDTDGETSESQTGPGGGSKRIFMTDVEYQGDLGGLAGADEKCAGTASSAGIGGAWRAWLSDDVAGIDAIDRVEGEGPWVRTDGEVAFPNRASLVSQPTVPLRVNAWGEELRESSAFAWTGTNNGGGASLSCLGFTTDADENGVIGDGDDPAQWTNSLSKPCTRSYHLLCFEQ